MNVAMSLNELQEAEAQYRGMFENAGEGIFEPAPAGCGTYVTVLQATTDFPLQPIFAGRYHDRFTRVDGRWQWTQREVIGDLYGDVSQHRRPDSASGPR